MRDRRGVLVTALAVVLLAATIVTPAGAHVGGSVTHLVSHLKAYFFTKSQSDARYTRRACPAGMAKVGPTCIDRYEASVWSAPTGGVQYGVSGDDYPCANNGQDCKGKIFARSVAGVQPSRFVTWFQAQQALAGSGKRLPTNAEWQTAVAGTPDDTSCNEDTLAVTDTGAHVSCKSDYGIYDMNGNLWEWVADWEPMSTSDCPGWGAFSSDRMCLTGGANPTTALGPAALARGGNSFNGVPLAGPFAVEGQLHPQDSDSLVGFRGAR